MSLNASAKAARSSSPRTGSRCSRCPARTSSAVRAAWRTGRTTCRAISDMSSPNKPIRSKPAIQAVDLTRSSVPCSSPYGNK